MNNILNNLLAYYPKSLNFSDLEKILPVLFHMTEDTIIGYMRWGGLRTSTAVTLCSIPCNCENFDFGN